MKKSIILLIFLLFFSTAHAYIFTPKMIDGKEYISLNDICDLYDYTFRYEYFPGKILLEGENENITFLPASRRCVVKDQVFTLGAPVKIIDGIIYIPIGFVNAALSQKVLNDAKNIQQDLKIKTIIVDAGHGGKDPGAIGPSGLMEKEVNLEIAKKLKQIINARLPVKVLMTREEDVFIPLGDRTKFANENGAELFISIHCNAAFSRETKGSETYYVSEADDPEARAVEVLENSVIKMEISELGIQAEGILKDILSDMIYHEYVHKSVPLAILVQKKITTNLQTEDKGVKHALFYVLRGVAAPSILVEVAFLSNRLEESKLANKNFRDKAAQAIFEGIEEYLKEKETVR